MKKNVFVFLLSLIGVVAMAQKNDVPAQIGDFISNKYPEAVIGKMKKTGKEISIKYVVGETKYLSRFTPDYTWKKTEYKVDGDALPTKVKNVLKKKHPKGTYKEVKVLESPMEVRYILVVINPNNSFDVIINDKGEVLKNEKVPDVPNVPKPVQNGEGE